MNKIVYILVGVQCSGKTYIMKNIGGGFQIVDKDSFIDNKDQYLPTILKTCMFNSLPVLTNAPFGVSEPMEELRKLNLNPIPVFVIESEEVLKKRYKEREGKDLPNGTIKRQETYKQRAKELKAFSGTSDQVLNHLRNM